VSTFRRRVQVTGGSTFIVSLPKEWARRVGISSGSEVVMEILPDYSLRVYPSTSARRRSYERMVVIDSLNEGKLIREVISSYLAGYTTVNVVFKVPSERLRAVLKEFITHRIVGLEILEETADSVLLHLVVDPSSLPLNEAIKKMAKTVSYMLMDVRNTLTSFDEGVLKSVIERDDTVDKLFLFVVKQLNLVLLGGIKPSDAGVETLAEALYILIGVKSIERIADHASIIARELLMSRGKAPLPDQVIELYEGGEELFNAISRSFINIDKAVANDVMLKAESLRREERGLREKLVNILNFPFVSIFMDHTKRIIDYSMDIAEAVINIATLREIRDFSSKGGFELSSGD